MRQSFSIWGGGAVPRHSVRAGGAGVQKFRTFRQESGVTKLCAILIGASQNEG